ncbi:MAG: hypothetical protein R6V37_02740 [Psychroflexus maritimus]
MKNYRWILLLFVFQFSFAQQWLDQQCKVETQIYADDIEKTSERNRLVIIINQEAKLMVNDEDFSLLKGKKFKDYLYAFIENPDEAKQWAKTPKKAMISLTHYNQPDQFEVVQQQIREVYYFLWNNYAQSKYHEDYVNLNCKQRAKVQKQYPYNVFTPKKRDAKDDSTQPKFSGPPPFEGNVKDN